MLRPVRSPKPELQLCFSLSLIPILALNCLKTSRTCLCRSLLPVPQKSIQVVLISCSCWCKTFLCKSMKLSMMLMVFRLKNKSKGWPGAVTRLHESTRRTTEWCTTNTRPSTLRTGSFSSLMMKVPSFSYLTSSWPSSPVERPHGFDASCSVKRAYSANHKTVSTTCRERVLLFQSQ